MKWALKSSNNINKMRTMQELPPILEINHNDHEATDNAGNEI